MKLLIVFWLAGGCFAADSDDVKKLDRQWAEATLHRDSTTLNRILADDLMYVHGNASVQNKQQFISSISSGDMVYHTIDLPDVDVRVFGSTAIVTSMPRISITIGGVDQNFQVRFLRVYVKRNGSWQLVAHQATRLP